MRYARLDGGTVIVTSGDQGIAGFTEDGPKLESSDAFRRAADEVGLGDRTGGFLYVDLDGFLPLVEGVSAVASCPRTYARRSTDSTRSSSRPRAAAAARRCSAASCG